MELKPGRQVSALTLDLQPGVTCIKGHMTKPNTPINKKKVLIDLGFTPIPDYEGYWAREDGKIASSNNRESRIIKILSPLVINSGYETVNIRPINKGTVRRTVHRLIALTFLPNPDNLPEINHRDGDKLNNCIENLEWISRSGNKKHALQKGLRIPGKGEKAGNSKLTESQVIEIHTMYASGVNIGEISSKYGISKRHVYTIGKAVEWKHLGFKGIYRGSARGERSNRSVLSTSQVLEIRSLHKSGLSAKQICKKYPCGISCIRHILAKRTWDHV